MYFGLEEWEDGCRYELAPNFVLTITREGAHLFVETSGQPGKAELYPLGEREYFLKAVDAQITFEVGGAGVANQLVLHQAGQDIPAKRIQ